MMTCRPAPYCSNWPYFEGWRRWDYNCCECDYMYERGEMPVEWREDGCYEAFDQTYLCDHCRGMLHGIQEYEINSTIALKQEFLKSGAGTSYTYFVDHLPMSVAKNLYGKYVWQDQIAKINRFMDAIDTAVDKVPAVAALCDYLITQRPFLSVNDGFRTATKEKLLGHPAATALLALIADIEAHP